MKIIKSLLFVLITFNILNSQTVQISALRNNDSNGVPVDSGKVFTITGIVTVGNEFNSPSYLQDNTAGIAVYARGTGQFSSQVQIGDSVIIRGKLSHFRGLTQFDSVASFSKISSGKTVIPTILTIADILSQNWNGYEAYEGMLIRVNNVTVVGSGNWTGNTNYQISDGTGTSYLRIVTGTNLVGQPIPTSSFDLVGVLGAFKSSAPYDQSSYQILPRNLGDIITDNKPLIVLPVIASNIDTSSFKVYFETLRDGDTEVRYGLTEALELGQVKDTTKTKHHSILVHSLSQQTRYYFEAFSSNSYGTSEGPIQTVTTASSNPLTGTINVYFNYSVDKTVAVQGNEAKGNVDFTDKLLQRINSTSYSIDMAVYSFYNQNTIVNALISARNRGVKVRIVYANRATQNSMQSLINAGFQVVKRKDTNGLMHNKFFVFDGRDQNPNNDWVWTGSWNVSGDESAWINNVIEINDNALAQAFTQEFEEMWGSNNDTPNVSNAKFGPSKSDNTSHFFTIGGRDVQCYFSPTDQTNAKIRNTLLTADSSIYFALYTFTRDDLANAILSNKSAGATFRGIIDNVNDSGSEYNYLKPHGEVFDYNLGTVLHHKYSIVDASYQNLSPYVITGSHNWSNSAENDNDENTLIIKDILIANQFMQEFKRRYNDLGGTGIFIIPTVVSVKDEVNKPIDIELYQNYPNPFNPVTTIAFKLNSPKRVELSLYNTLGEKVRTIFNGEAISGKTAIDFKADGLTSGVYFYQLKAGDFTSVKKLILLR